MNPYLKNNIVFSNKYQKTEDKKPVKLIVTEQHRSEYPNPINLIKGSPLYIGEKYASNEDWNNWYLCSTPGQKAGWVPEQLIEWTSRTAGKAKDAYSAKELDVNPGEIIWGSRVLNGWIWCVRLSQAEQGWVPLKNIRKIDE